MKAKMLIAVFAVLLLVGAGLASAQQKVGELRFNQEQQK